jgi:hypothetical protein
MRRRTRARRRPATSARLCRSGVRLRPAQSAFVIPSRAHAPWKTTRGRFGRTRVASLLCQPRVECCEDNARTAVGRSQRGVERPRRSSLRRDQSGAIEMETQMHFEKCFSAGQRVSSPGALVSPLLHDRRARTRSPRRSELSPRPSSCSRGPAARRSRTCRPSALQFDPNVDIQWAARPELRQPLLLQPCT